jgi:hypothetical protein
MSLKPHKRPHLIGPLDDLSATLLGFAHLLENALDDGRVVDELRARKEQKHES